MSRKYVLAAGAAALGVAAMGRRGDWKDHATRRQHSTAMRYDSAADEAWVAFFSADHPTDEGLRLGKQFRNRIEYLVDNKFTLPAGAEYPDLDTLAYLSYASHAGHGIGLWEADEPWHPAFEKVVMADKQTRDLGHQLDEEMWEGQIAAGEVDPADYNGNSARGRRALTPRQILNELRKAARRRDAVTSQTLHADLRLHGMATAKQRREADKLVDQVLRGSSARGRRAVDTAEERRRKFDQEVQGWNKRREREAEEQVIDALREQSYADFAAPWVLRNLTKKGYIVRQGDGYALTAKGRSHADFLFGRSARGRRKPKKRPSKPPTTKQRKAMGQKLQALPWNQASALYKRKHPQYKGIGGYPMNTRLRAIAARSLAVLQLNKGNLTQADVKTIFARTGRKYRGLPTFEGLSCKGSGARRKCRSVTT